MVEAVAVAAAAVEVEAAVAAAIDTYDNGDRQPTAAYYDFVIVALPIA